MSQTLSFGDQPPGRFFIKMHGLLNHFVITDAREQSYRPDEEEIRRVCEPRTGVGADQLVVIECVSNSGQEAGANAFMRLFNIDGREVEACGNATRCVAWLLMEEQGVDALTLETLAGLIECRRTGDKEVSCVMGQVSMNWQDVPLAEVRDTLHLNLEYGSLTDGVALSIGNPHIVYFVDDLDSVDIESLAPRIQEDALFPNGVNVGIAQIQSSDHMRLTVFERGLTTACGSGACVAVYAARERGLTNKNKMTVSMPAGDIGIEIRDDGTAVMTGPVAFCFSGNY